MTRTTTCLAAIVFVALSSAALADYSVEDKGTWPETWPKELEPLRGQSRTFEGPLVPLLHYAIPFTKREEFEAAWPHLLRVKSPGAAIVLRRAPNFWLGADAKAGVCVHTPPAGQKPDAEGAEKSPEKSIYIELVVDGDIVDLNRIPLPPDTPIIDERFKSPAAAVREPASGLIGGALIEGDPTGIAFHYEHGKLFARELIWERFHKETAGGVDRPNLSIALLGYVDVPHEMTIKVHHAAGGVNEDHGTLFVGERQLGQVGDDTAKAEIYVLTLAAGTHPVRWVLTGGTFQNSLLKFEDAQSGEPLRVFHDDAQRQKSRAADAREVVLASADPSEWLKAAGADKWRWVPLGQAGQEK